jgi:ABC-type transporter Mla MlaB component
MGKRDEEGLLSVGPEREGEIRLSLSGHISLDNVSGIEGRLGPLLSGPAPRQITIDLNGLESVDSAGGLFLLAVEEEAKDRSIPFEFVNMPARVRGVMDLFDRSALKERATDARPSGGLIEEMGKATAGFGADVAQCITFGGIRSPRYFRACPSLCPALKTCSSP